MTEHFIITDLIKKQAFFTPLALTAFHMYCMEVTWITVSLSLRSALCVLIASAVYTAQRTSFQQQGVQAGDYGYAYVVAWVAFPMTLASGLMYLVLRKRK